MAKSRVQKKREDDRRKIQAYDALLELRKEYYVKQLSYAKSSYNGYSRPRKTSVSVRIPDTVLDNVDRHAAVMGITRSEAIVWILSGFHFSSYEGDLAKRFDELGLL